MKNVEISKCIKDDSALINLASSFQKFKNDLGKSRIRSCQDVDDLRYYIKWIQERANTINSYLEVGPSVGGTFYIVSSFLAHYNDEFEKANAIDRKDKMRDWNEFKLHMANNFQVDCNMEVADSQKYDMTDKYYDLIFIDADHRFPGVLNDFLNYKDHCRYLGFHDIAYAGERQPCGVPAAWNIIKSCYNEYYEFINANTNYDMPMGIGVIDVSSIKHNIDDFNFLKKFIKNGYR